jgi:peptide/nickel transport system substrate-binding protein
MVAVSGSVTRLNPSLLYADSPFYTGEEMKPFYNQRNPARARQLLQEAGYKGERIIIHTNGVYAYMRSQMLVLEQALKDVGVNVEMRVTDWVTNANALQTGDGGFNVSMTGFCSQPLLGPQQWRALIYTTTGLRNITDPDVDGPYNRFFASFDINERRKAWLEAETAIRSKAYMVKISDAGRAIAINQRVQGWKGWYAMRNWDIWLD